MTERTYETMHQAASRTGFHYNTIRNRVADGTLKAFRFAGSRAIRLDPAEVDALMRRIPSAAA